MTGKGSKTYLYEEKDLEVFKQVLPELEKKQKILKLKKTEPGMDEIKKVMGAIIEYIKTNNLKVYGGYSQNLHIKQKNPKDAIYDDYDTPDIEIYSPQPLTQLQEICNKLQKAGFKEVIGQEALHEETYTIFVNQTKYCDITYVPTKIYNMIPVSKIDGFQLVHPSFMLTDYYRLMTSPVLDFFRIGKTFKRLYVLQKYYPFEKTKQPNNFPPKINKELENYSKTVYEFLVNRETIIIFGYYSYYYFLNGIPPNHAQVPYWEFISTNYEEDVKELKGKLESIDKNSKNNVELKEFYPFFQFTGRSVVIYVNGLKIAHIFSNRNSCVPYTDVFLEKIKNNETKKIRLSTFLQHIKMALIEFQWFHINKRKNDLEIQKYMIFNLYQTRNAFFEKNKKTFLDKTRFEELQLDDCVGETEEPDRIRRKKIQKRKEQGMPLIFKYNPETESSRDLTTYKFQNTSGNEIQNEKNKKFG